MGGCAPDSMQYSVGSRSGSRLAGVTLLDDQRFVFVTGKGGVGKTLVTVALGAELAARGKKTLLVVSGGPSKAAHLLGVNHIQPEPHEVQPGLYAVHIEPEQAMAEYGRMVLRSQTLYDTLFDNRYVRGFFRGIPGLREWALLGKAWFLSGGDGRGLPRRGDPPPFDVVVLDAPATGHGTDLLRVPRVIVDVAPGGRLRDDAQAAWCTLRDGRQTAVILVSLPEELPTTETLELAEVVRGELGLPLAGLVINMVQEPLFSVEERASLLALPPLSVPVGPEVALYYAVRRAASEGVQEENLRRLEAMGLPTVRFPRLPQEPSNFLDAAGLSGHFSRV